jgi:STE24 endopeptidase
VSHTTEFGLETGLETGLKIGLKVRNRAVREDPVESGMTSSDPTNPSGTSPILEGATLEQARQRETLKVIGAILGLVVSGITFILWVPGGAATALRDATGGDSGFGPRLAFVVAFLLISGLLEFPLGVYFDYTLGKRFGLLKQSFGGWFADQLKEAGVGLVFSGVLFLSLYAIFAAFPTLWFPIAMLVITGFFAVILLLQPRLARMRFKSAPLENPELEARVGALFQRANVPLVGVSKWLFGEKTKQGNAALSPVGAGSEVLISDTLLESVSLDGIEVVLAHELGHKVHRDIPKMLGLAWLQFALIVAIAYFALSSLGLQFGLRGPGDIATLPIFVFAFTVVGSLYALLTNAVSRRAEYAADRYALDMTGNVAAFEQTFRALARDNLSDPNPPEWVEIWLHDHPSIEKRIAAARAWTPRQA